MNKPNDPQADRNDRDAHAFDAEEHELGELQPVAGSEPQASPDNDPDADERHPGPLGRVRDARPGLLDHLRDALTSKRAQAERAQREADAEEQRLADMARNLNNLEVDCQRAEDELAKLDSQHKRFVDERASYLEAHRANWREGRYLGLPMAEIEFIIKDYPAHRAFLVERLAAATTALKAFKRKHAL